MDRSVNIDGNPAISSAPLPFRPSAAGEQGSRGAEETRKKFGILTDEQFPYFQVVLWTAILLSIVAACLFISSGFHNVHFDSKGHQMVARRMADNLTPGFKQIGGFWLPLPHLLYYPLVLNDYIYFHGLGGVLFSMISFVWTVVFLFKLVEKLSAGSRFPAFAASMIYMTNPNMLYLQSTSLTENMELFFTLGLVYFFVRYAKERTGRALLWCTLFSVLGILTRYECWFVSALAGLLLIILHLKDRRGWKAFFADAGLFGGISIFAMGLAFLVAYYATHHWYQPHDYKFIEFQPARGSFLIALIIIIYTTANLISWEWALLALPTFYLFCRKRFRDPAFIASLAMLGPILLYLLEYRAGLPVRVRYGLPFVPVFVYVLAYWPSLPSKLVRYLFVLYIPFVVLFGPFQAYSGELLMESMRDQEKNSEQADLLWYLRHNDDGRLILADMGEIAPVLYDLKLPIKRYVHQGAKRYWKEAMVHPEKVAGWVFLSQNDQLWRRFHDDPEFHKHYALVGRRNILELYRQTPDEQFNVSSHKDHGSYDKYPKPRVHGT